MPRKLSAGVERKLGKGTVNEGGGTHVCYDEGIHPCHSRFVGRFQGLGQLAVPNQGVEGQIDPTAQAMRVGHSLAKLGGIEIMGVHTSIEAASAQVNGVSPRKKGGF